jgi:hypothetical protein
MACRRGYDRAVDSPDCVLRRSRKKWLANLLLSLVLLALGLATRHDAPVSAWSAIILCGLSVAVSGAALLPGNGTLRLTPNGFEQRVLFQTHTESWNHIDHFRRSGSSVGIVYEPGYFNSAFGASRARLLLRANQSLVGVHGILSDTYRRSAQELTDLMNDWLGRYKGT